MSWSVSLGRIAGTEVRIHLTFLLLLVWFGAVAGSSGGIGEAFTAVAFILAVFACVLAHEFGHVLTARRFGINTRDITLLPIGGVASIERLPEKPGQELLIAVAGPLVNVVIAAVLIAFFGVDLATRRFVELASEQKIDFISQLALVNVSLVAFNLLPAFPMDGGRMLRALLSYRLGRLRATRIAATIGQAIAFGLAFLGLFGNPLLLFIALFVFLAAGQEAQAVEISEATKKAALGDATITSFERLGSQSTVGQAVKLLLATTQREFPVIDAAGHLRGVLTREGMIRALAQSGPETPVLDVMVRDVPVVNARAPLSAAVALLQSGGQPMVGVVDDEQRVGGIITPENLAEYLMVAEAGRGRTSMGAARA